MSWQTGKTVAAAPSALRYAERKTPAAPPDEDEFEDFVLVDLDSAGRLADVDKLANLAYVHAFETRRSVDRPSPPKKDPRSPERAGSRCLPPFVHRTVVEADSCDLAIAVCAGRHAEAGATSVTIIGRRESTRPIAGLLRDLAALAACQVASVEECLAFLKRTKLAEFAAIRASRRQQR